MLWSASPVGSLVVFSNVWIMSAKWDGNLWWSWSVINVRDFWCLLFEDEMIRRQAGSTGKLAQTSAWHSIRQLCMAEPDWAWEVFLTPFSLNVNSVIAWVTSKTVERHWWLTASMPIKWMLVLLKEVRTHWSVVDRSSGPNEIPGMEPKVFKWYAVKQIWESESVM